MATSCAGRGRRRWPMHWLRSEHPDIGFRSRPARTTNRTQPHAHRNTADKAIGVSESSSRGRQRPRTSASRTTARSLPPTEAATTQTSSATNCRVITRHAPFRSRRVAPAFRFGFYAFQSLSRFNSHEERKSGQRRCQEALPRRSALSAVQRFPAAVKRSFRQTEVTGQRFTVAVEVPYRFLE